MGTLLSPHQERTESPFSHGQEDPDEQGLRVDLPSIGGGKGPSSAVVRTGRISAHTQTSFGAYMEGG